MNKKTVITIVVVLVLVAIVTLYGQFVGFRPKSTLHSGSTQNTGQNPDQNQTEPKLITAAHQFKNGKHIIAGEIELPTPCHSLGQSVMVAESFPEQVTIHFTSQTQDEGLCAQVVTPVRFKTEFTASEDASIRATWNGEAANLNLVPVEEGEDLENFEIFVKG